MPLARSRATSPLFPLSAGGERMTAVGGEVESLPTSCPEVI